MDKQPAFSLREYDTLIDLLQEKVLSRPGQTAFTFLADGETEDGHLTYQELDQKARAIAALLQQHLGQPGERVLLLYPPGLEYISAFWGCLYAGMIAVPSYPPRLNRPDPRLQIIAQDAQARVALTTPQILSSIEQRLANTPDLAAIEWLTTEDLDIQQAEKWKAPQATSNTLAFLQYTSGSTAQPKGVMVSHGNLLHNLKQIHQLFGTTAQSRGVFWLPPYHDMGLIGGVLETLYTEGSSLIMPPTAFLQKPARWLQAISRYGATISGAPNFAYDFCVDKITEEQKKELDLSSWDLAFSGAEPIHKETLERFAATFEPYGLRREALYACYGLAEATLIASGGSKGKWPTIQVFAGNELAQNQVVLASPEDKNSRELVSCGQCTPDQKLLIVEPQSFQPCPADQVGEIWLAGPSVAQGYWNRPEETAQTFQARLADSGEGPFMRTGDLGFLHDGEIYITGRAKDLIIIRGRNHYPQDIELTVENSHSSLAPSSGAAFSVEVQAEERLVIVQEVDRRTKQEDAPAIIAAVRQAVAEQHELQAYAVVLIRVGSIPRTSSFKIQRRACKAQFLDGSLSIIGSDTLEIQPTRLDSAEPQQGQTGLIGKALAAISDPLARQTLLTMYLQEQAARILHVPAGEIDPQQPLNSFGLDSMMAVELKYAIETELQISLPMEDFLQGGSASELVARILNSEPDASAAVLQPGLEATEQHLSDAYLSSGQRSLWFLHQLAPDSAAYNIAHAVTIRAALDVPALHRAFGALVERHPALRTIFPAQGDEPVQHILAHLELPFRLEQIPDWDEDRLQEFLAEEAQRPFDLEHGPLLRVTLLSRSSQEHILQLVVHHIVADFWSLAVLADELGRLYAVECLGKPFLLELLPVQYGDYVRWQAGILDGTEGARLLGYWQQKLAGDLPALDLPTDHPRPPAQTYRGASQSLRLSSELTRKLKDLSQQCGATLYMTLLAAFQVLLHRYTGQTDILIGSPTAGRSRVELSHLVGYFVNPIVLRCDLSGNVAFTHFLEQVCLTVLEAFAHQDYPFGMLVEHLQPRRDPSRSPIFQVMFVLQKTPLLNKPELASFALGEAGVQLDLHGLPLESMAVEQLSAQFDLTLAAAEALDGLGLSFQYNRDLFDETTIRRMLEHLYILLDGIVAQPEQQIASLPLLPPRERQIVAAWNDRQAEYPQQACIHELFEAQVERTPDDVAVVFEKQSLTYRELNVRANQLAHYLRSLGVVPGALVGLCVERSFDMLVGLLGILKAGGAYIPLDPMYPKDRLAYMLDNSKAAILLTQSHLSDQLPEVSQKICLDTDWPAIAACQDTNLAGHFSNNHLAYVIYTSGSTGTPKGVQLRHRSVVNFLHSMRQEPGLNDKDVLVSVTTLAFDIAALELFLPISVGARLILASRAVTMDGSLLSALLSSSGATCMQATPATWRLLLEAGWAGDAKLKILCGGEALPRDLANLLLERCGELWNMYGPTETTIWSSTCRVENGEGPISIGHPIANTQLYILDTNGDLAPIGVPGELVIGGDGLAQGYFQRPDLTAEKFIPDPFARPDDPEARLYKTGDLARFRTDENGELFIEFLGRLDHQVKVRGFRIELAEIESLLNKHPALKESVVVAQDWGASGEKRLVAYIIPSNGSAPAAGELRSFLKEKLPDYMLPSAFITLEALPLTPNGKVNRKALPVPKDEAAAEAEFVAPRGEMEQTIAKIWQEVLQLEKVGTRDNFFDLGGHSLLMARVHRRLRDGLGREISMVELFQYPTIDSLVKYLSTGSGHKSSQPGGSRARFRRGRMTQPEAGIAVVAMVGRFPGAGNMDEYWQNLSNGVESIRPFSDEELLAAGVDPALLADPNYVRAGAALDEVEEFDAAFFGYSPHEAEILDPQHRLFLECAWEALERAGYDSERYVGRIGVYASAGLNSYLINNLSSNRQFMQTADGYQTFIANDKDFVPTRVSYKLNLRGPSVNVQTACSSSLVAIHMASQSLLAGECDMALAGGVSINVPHKAGYLYQERGIASPDGHCRAFDAQAGGTVRGNGVGIVVLKRLSDAIAQRDQICAVIRGSAINNDGSLKVGYTAPSIQGQSEAIAEALEISGVDPETISYVETHGTGTEMGDPIEVTALTQAFRSLTDKQGFCAIGSVKTNIGHLDTAAGAAGFIKTVLSLQHQAIPPSLNFEKPNPNIDFENSPFYVNTRLAEWKPNGTPLRAGVSSFGVGGTNAHIVLEAAPAPEPSGASRAWQLLVLSAKTETALASATLNLASYLKQNADQDLADAAYTLQVGRRVFNYRRVLVCRDRAEAVETLESLDPRKVLSAAQELKDRPVAFMFTGQGAQYVNMGAGLYETEPVFRQEIDRCVEILQPHIGLDLRRLLYPAPGDDLELTTQQLNQTQFTQPALFVIEYAMARLWMGWGLQPNAMIGHSIGEYVAACLAGVFSLEDALALVAARGRLMQSLPAGTMLAIPMSEKDVLPLLGEQLSLAAVNARDLCVVSGPEAAVEELERRLSSKGVGVQRLHTSHAFHSAMVDPILDAFQEQVAAVKRNAPGLPCISNVTGEWLTAEQAIDPAYWAQHLRQAVRFAYGVKKLFSDPAQILLEVGPGRTLNTLATRHPARAETHVILSSLRHPQDQQPDAAFLLNTLGKLWLAGAPIGWAGFYANEQRRRLPLPTYPFERQRFWVEADSAAAQPARLHNDKKKADMADWFYVPSWKRSALANSMTHREENAPTRWLLFADEYGLGVRLAAQLEKDGHEVAVVQAGETFIKQSERTYTLNPGHSEDYEALFGDLHEQGKLPQAIVHAWNVTPDERVLNTIDQSLDRSFYSLLYMAQALGKRSIPEEIRVIALCNDLQEVTGEEHVIPEKATQLGPVQIISLEYPQLRCRSVDIGLFSPGKGIPQKLVETLGLEINVGTSEPVVAYRGPHRWVQTFEPVRLEEPKETAPRLRQEGVYLITGGLGGVGLTLARHMAQRVHARLVLLGQTELPLKEEWSVWLAEHAESDSISRKIQQVQEIEQLGGQVLLVRADVTDPAQVQAAVAQSLEHFGAIHGVIHAAGVPGGGVIQLKTRSMAESVMAAKVRGTLALVEAFQEHSLDFIVLCSSINAVVGRLGQVDYVAANAFLDAFAHAHPTLPVIDINWETWREAGMAAAAMQQWSAKPGEGKTAQAIDHPLLVQRLPINEAADVYVSNLQVSRHWELNEHWVLNKPTLPGTAYLEMARAAFETHTGQGVMEFRDVFFLKPLILEGDEQIEVRTLLKKQGNGFAFSVMSKADVETDRWQEHAKGTVSLLEASELVQQDLAEIEARCREQDVPDPLAQSHLGHFRLERGSFLTKTDSDQNAPAKVPGTSPLESILITDETDAQPRSMEFGPRWKTLKWVKLGADEGLGLFELSEAFRADMDVYKLHPALLDFAASFLRLFKSEGSYLPLSYKRLKMSGPLPTRFYSHARFVGEHQTNSATLRFDLSLLDEHGTEWVKVEEFSVVKIGDAAKLSAVGRSTSPDEFFDAQRLQRELGLRASGLSKDLAEGLLSSEGVQVFDRILSSGLSRVVVSTRDLQARIEQSRAQSTALVSGTGEQAASRPRHPRPQLMTTYAVPRNQTEQKLAEIWQDVLGIDQVGVHDNFFELGGDSLLITRVHAKFVEVFERDMSVANLMQYPTIADLAQQFAQSDDKTEEPSFEAVRERTSKQKEAMQLRKQKMLKQRQR